MQARADCWINVIAICAVLTVSGVLAAQNAKPPPEPPTPGEAISGADQGAVRDLPKTGSVEIISDTQGVDFGPYLEKAIAEVRGNWYKLIPTDAETKKGELAIEFAVLPDGRIASMKLAATSGDVSLDRPAWGAISASSPFAILPKAFTGPYLALRVPFYYNPEKASPIMHAAAIQSVAAAHPPMYPKRARKDRIEGAVQLDVEIAADGKIKNVYAVEGSTILAGAASDAIRKWLFYPARLEGKPVEDRVRIRVEFRLKPQQVKTDIMSSQAPPR